MRVAALLTLVALAASAGCGGRPRSSRPPVPAYSADGKAVLKDAYDGRLDRDWACGSLGKAIRRLPPDPPMFSTLAEQLRTAAGRACDTATALLHRGMTEAQVRARLGPPDEVAPVCWLYAWPPLRTSAEDGVRVCFAAGRVERIQISVHG